MSGLSLLDVVVVAFLTLLLVLGARNLPSLWRHEVRGFDSPQVWWPFGDELWRGFVRALHIGWAGGAILVAALVIGAFVPTDRDQWGFEAPLWYVVPVLVLFFGTMLLILLVVMLKLAQVAGAAASPGPARCAAGMAMAQRP